MTKGTARHIGPRQQLTLLADPDDLVLDIFGGSCTTGEAAEQQRRRWITIDMNLEYVKTRAFRFLGEHEPAKILDVLKRIDAGETVHIEPLQPLFL